MYKVLDVRDNSEIIILEPRWAQDVEKLRVKCHQDFLVCQECMQPVWVKAGEFKQKHFAHKHLAGCTYGSESQVLLSARSVLYEWLVLKFGEKVSIEKKVENQTLHRPVDCWVENESKQFAYWIFDSGMRPNKRQAIASLESIPGLSVNWIFVAENLHCDKEHPESIVHLSTTERMFLKPSKYDYIWSRGYKTDGTLHYLDAEKRELVTYRSLGLYHSPQTYKGHRLTNEIDQILVSPESGEFVHPGEFEQYRGVPAWPWHSKEKEPVIGQAPNTSSQIEKLSLTNNAQVAIPPDDNAVVDTDQKKQKFIGPIPIGKTRWEQYSYEKYPHLVPKDSIEKNDENFSDRDQDES